MSEDIDKNKIDEAPKKVRKPRVKKVVDEVVETPKEKEPEVVEATEEVPSESEALVNLLRERAASAKEFSRAIQAVHERRPIGVTVDGKLVISQRSKDRDGAGYLLRTYGSGTIIIA